MKNVLFIAHNFPPHGGAGVQRSLKFVKYLPQFGWRPLVVAATPEAAAVQDPSLTAQIPPEALVVRVPSFSIPPLQKRFGRAAVLLNILLQLPDAARFWARAIRPTLAKLVERETPALVYSSSGPYSAHLAGQWASQHFGLPWLADFRDPWSQNLLMPYPPGYRWLNAQLERRVLAHASRVACVSRPWLMDLQANLGHSAEKFIVLPNGYDEADIAPTPLPPHGERLILTHMGSFYRNRRPQAVIDAVQQLVAAGRVPTDQLCVRFIGKNARRFVPAAPPFEVVDYVPHRELARYRAETHVLLLILATSAANIGNHSGKLFEYIASNRPILGIVPPNGVAQELLETTRTGTAVGGEVATIADAIEAFYQRWLTNEWAWQPDWAEIGRYSRRQLTAQLAHEFEQMVTHT